MFLVIVNDIFVVDSADCRVDQHDINIVMMLRLFLGPDSLERSALHSVSTGPHFSQRRVTPSLVAPRSGSPRYSGTVSSMSSVVASKMEKSSPAIKSLMTASFLRSPNDFRSPTYSAPPLPEEP